MNTKDYELVIIFGIVFNMRLEDNFNMFEDFSNACKFWDNDDTHTKFKMGQLVKNKKDGNVYRIKGVNIQDEDSIEYALIGYPYLVWEDELEKIGE